MIDPLPKPPADSDSVRDQLCEAVREAARVRICRQWHPYGSTFAAERQVEIELPEILEIPLETDTLPTRCLVRLRRQGVDVPVECHLRSVCGGNAAYEISVHS